ncbi:hypothetical protein B0H11DRAFT_2277538 [Mycena galericulata]|nr:hypothetical protein B0H11DRAFT_2277538 [Mycena galericulata]
MPAPATYFTILTAISQLPPLSLALWAPGKAAQINFFTNDICTQYVGEVAAWWTMASLIGGPGPMAAQAECISLNMPSNSQSTATVDVWEPTNSTASTTTWPPYANGSCTFWDGLNCSGNEASSNSSQAHGLCLPARSENGVLWQSAKCFFLESLSPSMSSLLAAIPTSQISPAGTANPAPSLPISPSFSSSGISTNPSSSTSPQGSPSFISMSLSAPTQSAVRGMNKNFSAGTIAGLTVGVVATLVSLSIVAFCIWRARRKREPAFPTYGYFPPAEGQQRRPMRQKPGAGATVTMIDPRSPVARQELGRNNDGDGDGSTAILELAMRQNNILEARMRALERAYMGPPLSDSLPPGYLD